MVERGGLENRCSLRATEGSNPSLSAGVERVREGAFFYMLPWVPIEGMVFESLPLRWNKQTLKVFTKYPANEVEGSKPLGSLQIYIAS